MKTLITLLIVLTGITAHAWTKREITNIYRNCQQFLRMSPAAQQKSAARIHHTVQTDLKACREITRRSLPENIRLMVGGRGRGGVDRPSIGSTDREGKGDGPITCSGSRCSSYGSGQQPDLDCGSTSPGSSNWCRTSSGSPTNIRCDTDSSGNTSCHRL